MFRTVLLAGVLATGSCANWQATKDAVISEAAKANDADAEIKHKVGCTMTLIAWGRLKDPRIQDGEFYACVPESVADRYGVTIGHE